MDGKTSEGFPGGRSAGRVGLVTEKRKEVGILPSGRQEKRQQSVAEPGSDVSTSASQGDREVKKIVGPYR
jgi:hypothetical protein